MVMQLEWLRFIISIKNELNCIKEVRVVELNSYDTCIIYIKEDSEYILPLQTNDLFTNLEVHKLYKASEFIEVLSQNSQENNGNTEAGVGIY